MSKSNKATPLEILIVDDDKVVALLHRNQLKTLKVEVSPVICSNGKEGQEYLSKNDLASKHFLVLLDLNMPIINGWKFLKWLEKNPLKGKVYVVVVTSSINQKDYLKAQTFSSVIHFCKKPLDAACVTRIKNFEPLREFFRGDIKEAERPEN